MTKKASVVVLLLLTITLCYALDRAYTKGTDPRMLRNWVPSYIDELLGTGGPDAYGYRWIDSDTTGGPTYNWVDITSIGTQVTGLGDDNVVGPFSIGFEFPYYWYTVDHFWICSNGVISFSYSDLWIPHDEGATLIPNPALPNDLLLPLGGDLNFAFGRGEVYYYTNNVDSLIISFIDVPEWHYPGDTFGSHTFQVILYKGDSSITFQYGPQRGNFNYYTGATRACAIGIENVSGQVGLQYLYNNYPSENLYHDSLAILFYPPDTTFYQALDIGLVESGNELNRGFFLLVGEEYTPYMLVKNTGNTDIESYTAIFNIKKAIGTYVYSDTITGGPLVPGEIDTVYFTSWAPDTAITYDITSWVTCDGDMMPFNDSVRLDMRAISGPSWLTYMNDSTNITFSHWYGAGAGWGARFVPPAYPCVIESVGVIMGVAYGSADAVIMILDDNGENGMPGTILAQDTITVDDTANWYYLVPEDSVVIEDGAFYVGVIQLQDTVPYFGTDQTPPFSRQFLEYTGCWAFSRDKEVSDPCIKVKVTGPLGVEEMPSPLADPATEPSILSVSPSVARDRITVDFAVPTDGEVHIKLYNVAGQLAKTWNLGARKAGTFSENLNIHGLQGIYFLRVESSGCASAAKKVLLVR